MQIQLQNGWMMHFAALSTIHSLQLAFLLYETPNLLERGTGSAESSPKSGLKNLRPLIPMIMNRPKAKFPVFDVATKSIAGSRALEANADCIGFDSSKA